MKVEPTWTGIAPLQDESRESAFCLCFPSYEDRVGICHQQMRKQTLTRPWICHCHDLGFPDSTTMRNTFLCLGHLVYDICEGGVLFQEYWNVEEDNQEAVLLLGGTMIIFLDPDDDSHLLYSRCTPSNRQVILWVSFSSLWIKYLRRTTWRRRDFVWLMVSVVTVYGWLTPLF